MTDINKNEIKQIPKNPLGKVAKTLSITKKLLDEISNREPNDDFRVAIPDEAFQEYLKDIGVKVENGTVAYGEIKNIEQIQCSVSEDHVLLKKWRRGYLDSFKIKSLEGLNYFKNLRFLYCVGHQISKLDVSNNNKLESLRCCSNQLTNLDVSKNIKLVSLFCDRNQLTTLDVSKNINIEKLYCNRNQLITLNVTKNINLITLSCSHNKLTSLDVSSNLMLGNLIVYENQLTTLNLLKNIDLYFLAWDRNKILSIDFSNNPKLLQKHR